MWSALKEGSCAFHAESRVGFRRGGSSADCMLPYESTERVHVRVVVAAGIFEGDPVCAQTNENYH